MARRRRRRRFGAITLRQRQAKIYRAAARQEQLGRGQKTRKIRVNVFVHRGDLVTDYTRKHGYWAWACTSKHQASGLRREAGGLAEKRRKSCGEDMWGRTPTAAVKRALVKLGSKKELR